MKKDSPFTSCNLSAFVLVIQGCEGEGRVQCQCPSDQLAVYTVIDGLEIVAASAGRARARDCQQVPAPAALQLVLTRPLLQCQHHRTSAVPLAHLSPQSTGRRANGRRAARQCPHSHIYIHTTPELWNISIARLLYKLWCWSICSTVVASR